MKGAAMPATLQRLGVAGSRRRRAVSNDNFFTEALFRTLKYRPQLPVKPLESLLKRAARAAFAGLLQRSTSKPNRSLSAPRHWAAGKSTFQ